MLSECVCCRRLLRACVCVCGLTQWIPGLSSWCNVCVRLPHGIYDGRSQAFRCKLLQLWQAIIENEKKKHQQRVIHILSTTNYLCWNAGEMNSRWILNKNTWDYCMALWNDSDWSIVTFRSQNFLKNDCCPWQQCLNDCSSRKLHVSIKLCLCIK